MVRRAVPAARRSPCLEQLREADRQSGRVRDDRLDLVERAGARDASGAMIQPRNPGSRPSRRRGMRPAATTLDLPEPDGPTSATRRTPSRSASSSRSAGHRGRRSRPASSSLNGRRPLYGLRACDRGARRRPPAGHERRVVEEDPLLQSLKRRRRVEAELLDEELREALVGAKRLGVAAGAVERQHQELARALAQRDPRGSRHRAAAGPRASARRRAPRRRAPRSRRGGGRANRRMYGWANSS